MGIFAIEIKASGGHGCQRTAGPGEKLYGRCQKLTCPDCLAYDFTQMLRQKGYTIVDATFKHFAGSVDGREVVDDLLKNERRSGEF